MSYKLFSIIYPKKIKEKYSKLLKYLEIKINPDVFIGFITFFGFGIALLLAFYLNIITKVNLFLLVISLFLSFEFLIYLYLNYKVDKKANLKVTTVVYGFKKACNISIFFSLIGLIMLIILSFILAVNYLVLIVFSLMIIFVDFSLRSNPEMVYNAPDFLLDVQPKTVNPAIFAALGAVFGFLVGWLLGSRKQKD